MKYVSLADASACYAVAQNARLSWRVIEHPALEELAEAVFKLSRLATHQEDQTGWREFLYPARRARNIATTVPLPFSHPQLGIRPLIDRLEQQLPVLRVYGGDDAGALGEHVASAGRTLISLDDAPLLSAVLNIAEHDGEDVASGLVLPIPEYVAAVDAHLKAMRISHPIGVFSRHDISDAEPLGRLIVVGPLYWYDDHQYVLTSPRAAEIIVLKWAWYREHPPATTALVGSRGAAGIKLVSAPLAKTRFATSANDERTAVDWRSVSNELSNAVEGDPSEPVPARAAILAGRNAVLLPEEGERLVWTLDPHAPPEHRVARVDIADLEPGHVIMLRTAGGGDLIVPIADEVLGSEARRLRELQHRWKASLRSWVREQGSTRKAADALRRAGCRKANPQNLQNWLSERSLRTEDRRDWQALMTAASLEADAEVIWRAMGKLHSAHLEAGRSIGRRLREMANTQALDTLIASGLQEFRLAGGGSVTAFRIEGFSPLVIQSPPGRLMMPTPVRDEWLT